LEYAEEIETHVANFQAQELTVDNLTKFLKSLNRLGFDNRFFTLDFIQILKQHKKIKKHHQTVVNLRQNLFENTLLAFVEQGIMSQEEIQNEYKSLVLRLCLLSDYWLIYTGTNSEELLLKETRIQTDLCVQSLYPYLTEKGKSDLDVPFI
jgi:hypothetical protein